MRTVVFVMPFFGENARRYLRALAGLDGAELAIVSQQPIDALPPAERKLLAAHYQVRDCMDEAQLTSAVRALRGHLGKVDRLVGFLEQTQEPIAAVREALGIEGLWTQAARNFRDKDRMKAVLRDAGLPVAQSARIERPADLVNFVERVGFPVVVKPIAGLGSKATFRVKDAAGLRRALEEMNLGHGMSWQAEEFVVGEENTFEAVTIDGKVTWWSGTWYRPGPLTVLENGWIQYTVLLPRKTDSPQHKEFAALNAKALTALGMADGLSHMEWFRTRDGRMIVSEVGARPPGVHIMPMMGVAHACDMIEKWAELVVFSRFDAPKRVKAAGVAFFRAQGPGDRITEVRGVEEAHNAIGHLVSDRQLPVVGMRRSAHYEGEGWAMVADTRTAVVEDALKTLIQTVQVRAQ